MVAIRWLQCRNIKRSRLISLLGALAFIIVLHFILKFEGSSDEKLFMNIDIDIPEHFNPIRTTKREIFPSTGAYKIPKIIHQTWKDTEIPSEFVTWIESWLEKHPDWQYWLWTDESAEQLIAERYPDFLDIFKGYTEPIRRADALRYIVLYEFGGMYADMDLEALTPLDPLALKYSCFIGQEPFEHPVLDTNFEQLLINAFIACKKGHPFMKMLIDSLAKYSILWHYLDSTGPHFVTHIYRQYLSEYSNLLADENYVYVTPSEYFYPTIDPVKIDMFVDKCNKASYLSHIQMKACRNLKSKQLPKNKFDAKDIAFTDHHWYHTYLKNMLEVIKSYKPIFEIVPKVKIFSRHGH